MVNNTSLTPRLAAGLQRIAENGNCVHNMQSRAQLTSSVYFESVLRRNKQNSGEDLREKTVIQGTIRERRETRGSEQKHQPLYNLTAPTTIATTFKKVLFTQKLRGLSKEGLLK